MRTERVRKFAKRDEIAEKMSRQQGRMCCQVVMNSRARRIRGRRSLGDSDQRVEEKEAKLKRRLC